MRFLDKLKCALKKTSENILVAISGKKVGDEFYQEVEDALIKADVGVQAAALVTQKLAAKKFSKESTENEIKEFLMDEIIQLVKPYESGSICLIEHNPEIILVIGANGSGKTTTIAKLASILKKEGHNPMLIAADTFRAAAVEQLKYWGKSLSIEVFSGKDRADAAGLVYSGIEKAHAGKNDVVLIDTAGRTQNRDDLLAELEKIKRVIKKIDNSAPYKTVLVLDGLIGQTAHVQVDVFFNKIGVDGLIVTKLDSSAKGGVLISLTQKYKIPVLAIGTGEKIDDLQPFSAEEYTKAIFGG